MMTNIAAASYTLAAVAYLVLGVLLLTSWRGRLHGMVLPIACLLSVLWAAALAYHASHDFALSLVTDILEIARNAGWSAFLITLLGLNRDGFFNGNGPHDWNSSQQAINERADLTDTLMKPVSAPLICIKAFRYSARGIVMPTPSSASAQSFPISA